MRAEQSTEVAGISGALEKKRQECEMLNVRHLGGKNDDPQVRAQGRSAGNVISPR